MGNFLNILIFRLSFIFKKSDYAFIIREVILVCRKTSFFLHGKTIEIEILHLTEYLLLKPIKR